jgi:putative flippase GtrA
MRRSLARWMKFNLVGAFGIGVQLVTLWTLTGLGVGYMLATALAVETAVLHNFIWHERFTWADRDGGRRHTAARLLRFNLTNGVVSIGGNLLLMRLLVGEAHLQPLVADLVSIAACSLVNFLVSDRWVFRTTLSRATFGRAIDAP